MGVEKTLLKEGNATDVPKKGDDVTVHYTGWLYDPNLENTKGNEFDSSASRGEFKVKIGVGSVIKGWDEGIQGMSLGEKSTLTITGDYAYGPRGFPGLIPPNATLVFDVELLSINGKRA